MITRSRWVSPPVAMAFAVFVAAGCTDPADPGGSPSLAKAPSGTLAVIAVDPDSVPQRTTLDIRVLGSGFDLGSTAEFLLDGQPDPRVRTNSTRYVKSTELVANVTITSDAIPSRYDAMVTTRGGKKGIGTELLEVLPYIELGTLSGPASSGFGINDEGSVTGRADTASGGGRAFVWDARAGAMRSLGPLESYAINNDRTVAGIRSGIGPVIWRYDAATDGWSWTELPSPTGDNAFPMAMNNRGGVVGWADSVIAHYTMAIYWPSPDTYVALDSAVRWSYSLAEAINEDGWVAGWGRSSSTFVEAWVWVPDVPGGATGRFAVLPRFGSHPIMNAKGINDAGDVVGFAQSAKGANYALLWRRNPTASRADLSDLYLAPMDIGGGKNGRAHDINNAGIVVGRAHTSTNRLTYAPFVWEQTGGLRLLPRPPGGDGQVARISDGSPAYATGSISSSGSWRAIRWLIR